jgi:hypothetical protein
MPNQASKSKKLAVLNRRIVRLGSELETLQFMKDHLERELERGGDGRGVSSSLRRPRRPHQRGRRS